MTSMSGQMFRRWLRSARGYLGSGFEVGDSSGHNLLPMSRAQPAIKKHRGEAASLLTLIPDP